MSKFNNYGKYIDHPVLSKEEQQELIVAYKENNDLKARDKLILHNLKFVHSIALEYKFDRHQMEDIIQEGMKGLIVAPDKFNLEKDVCFGTYAGWWIRAYILKFITDNFRMVKVGTTNNKRKIFWNLAKETRKLEVEGIVPDNKTLAATLGVKEKEIEEVSMRMASSAMSIDSSGPSGTDESKNWIESLLPSYPSPEEGYNSYDLYIKMQKVIDDFKHDMKPFHVAILEKRIIQDENTATLAEIGQEFGRTRERVRQLEVKIKDKLIQYLKNNGFESE